MNDHMSLHPARKAGIRPWLFAATFVAACLAFPCAADEPVAEGVRPLFWCAPEIASGHISIGRVKVTHPVQNFDAGLGAEYAPVGYALVGIWSLTDLSRESRDTRHPFWNEIDPLVAVGRRQRLAEGYSLDSRVGTQWNCMAGYEGAARRSYDEWQLNESLTTPYVTPWFAMRNFYWPVAKASFRVGLLKSFPVTDDLSFTLNVWSDGGSERWNEQRFGYRHARRIGSGLNSVSVRLFATYRLFEQAEIFGGVTGYTVVNNKIRDELNENPSDEALDLYAVVTCGIRISL